MPETKCAFPLFRRASASAGDTFGAASACAGSLALVPNGRITEIAAQAAARMEEFAFMGVGEVRGWRMEVSA